MHLEATDNDVIAGPKVGRSRSFNLEVFSKVAHRRKLIEKVENAWKEMISGVDDDLNGVWGIAGDEVLAVGGKGGQHGLVLRYDGRQWRTAVREPRRMFHAIWGGSSDAIFAVGEAGLIQRFDGTTWQHMASGVKTDLTSVWGTSATNVFAAGNGATLLHYDGTRWGVMTRPSRPT